MRACWLCAGAGAICLLVSALHPGYGWPLAAATATLAVIAAAAPFTGVLVFAGLSPLWAMVTVLSRATLFGPGVDQAPALALIAGWASRRAFSSRRFALSAGVRGSATILVALAVSSAIVVGTIFLTEHPDVPASERLWTMLTREYFVGMNALTHPLLFIEGLVVLLIAADSCSGDEDRRRQVMRMMVAGAAAAALLNVVRIVELPVQHQLPWSTIADYLGTARVNVHYSDVNAAGSYFTLVLYISVAVAWRAGTLWPAATLLILLGLWMTGSRIALAAALVTCAAGSAAVMARRFPRHRLGPALAGLLLVALAGASIWWWYPASRNVSAATAFAVRAETGKAALLVAGDHPWFGAGLGRLYQLSQQYASQPENAHNNFLQVLAELGITGLIGFGSLMAFALRDAWRSGRWGLIAGLGAYLLSCLGGHPLLVASAAYPFWIAMGLAAAPEGTVSRTPPRWSRVIAGAVLVLAIALPFRVVEATRQAYLEHASVGLSAWQHGPDDSRYRWAAGRSRFYIDASARAVAIPLRAGPGAPNPVEVRVRLNGREVNRILLSARADWQMMRILLTRREDTAFVAIDLEVAGASGLPSSEVSPNSSSGVLMVGRPVIER